MIMLGFEAQQNYLRRRKISDPDYHGLRATIYTGTKCSITIDKDRQEAAFMGIKSERAKILAELRKSLAPEEEEKDRKDYTFRQYTIDGRRYSTLDDLGTHEVKIVTPEESTVINFAKMLSESSDPKSKDFARTIRNLLWLHQSGKERLKDTPVYQIAKEYADKTLSTRPRSVERDMLLITAIEKIKVAYRALIRSEKG